MNEFEFSSRRSPVYATRGMVAASQPLAAQAGLDILMGGGNAADAAVATAAALNVTEPTSTGLGGDMFALFYDASARQVTALNGSGRAPAALSLDALKREGLASALPPFHAHTITVPGACAGWCDLLERHGSRTLADVLAPAIRMAEEGFPVAPTTAYFWERGAQRQLATAPGGQELLIEGRAPRAGEIFRNPTLAATLRTIADQGKTAFYEGEIAEKIVAVVQSRGGLMTLSDLTSHRSTWDEPISADYRGVRVFECPPNGQGLATLLALNILSSFGPLENPLSAHDLHLIIESLRLAFADTAWYVADPTFATIPLAELLSADYAAERAARINPNRATLDHARGVPVAATDTVYFSVVDGMGNACSFINSNYMGFGTGIVPPGTGFSLQNRGHNFSLQAGHPNMLAPGKRPYHTIIPALATYPDRSLYASFGVMGGFMQPQGHLQVLVALRDYGLDPQAALDLPRVCIEDGAAGGGVAVERGIPTEVVNRLSAMGHPTRQVAGFERALFGRGQIIVRMANGAYCGGSDPRADGGALGF